MFNQIGNATQRTVYNAFRTVPYFIEHGGYAVFNIGYLSGNGLALFFHEVIEHAALIGKVLQCFLDFRESDFPGFNHFTYLAFCYP